MNWHTKNIEDIVHKLGASIDGLTWEDAKIRLEKYGLNELKEKAKKTPFSMFLSQFKDLMIIILIVSATIAGFLGKPVDSLAILAIVILNALVGFVQEYKAEKAMEALKMMSTPNAYVLRDGQKTSIPSNQIVPGDIVFLEAGNIVPADIRLLETNALKIDESILTGESVPVEKNLELLHDKHLPLGDRKNMAYQGTVVTYGRGKGLVVATGMNTEIGKIAELIQAEKEGKSPLQQRLAIFGRKLAIGILVICAIVFITGILRGESMLYMFLTAISLAVAAIPEALPAVITISLAFGAKKMAEKNALIRKLSSVETLGSVTYICTDKTGTLTQNKMVVQEVFVNDRLIKNDIKIPENDVFKLFLLSCALNNDAHEDDQGKIFGDPTEIALYTWAKNQGYIKSFLEKKYPRIGELPFDSDRKCMTTIHEFGDDFLIKGKYVSITKGAFEVLVEKASGILTLDGVKPLEVDRIRKISNDMAKDGLRVIAIGIKFLDDLPSKITVSEMENNLILVGLVGMIDPPREEAKESVVLAKSAGIIPVMITGDHPLTAYEIARRIGIIDENDQGVLTGRELEKMSLEEFEKKVEHIRVYARVAPEQKLKIVQALQDKNQFVAMTGDGVNDSPALKKANIGIAMGITGSDVAKEASSMILLDDNFATIVKAVKEGRRIYDNILKFIMYSMTSNAGTLWAVFLAPFLNMPLPMYPIQILWLNLLCDSLPGLALTAEPAEENIMRKKPRTTNEGIFSHGRGLYIVKNGLFIGILALFFQYYAINKGLAWQTIIFSSLVIGRMAVVLSIRNSENSIFKVGIKSNVYLIIAVLFTIFAQLAVVYVPPLQVIFNTKSLNFQELSLTFLFFIIVLLFFEFEKLFKSKS